METITPVTEYIQAHLDRISSNELGDGDVLNMLGGEGGVQVDVVFYMVTNRKNTENNVVICQTAC